MVVLDQQINVVERNIADVKRYFWVCAARSEVVSKDRARDPFSPGKGLA